jgi:hypothetical protein
MWFRWIINEYQKKTTRLQTTVKASQNRTHQHKVKQGTYSSLPVRIYNHSLWKYIIVQNHRRQTTSSKIWFHQS